VTSGNSGISTSLGLDRPRLGHRGAFDRVESSVVDQKLVLGRSNHDVRQPGAPYDIGRIVSVPRIDGLHEGAVDSGYRYHDFGGGGLKGCVGRSVERAAGANWVDYGPGMTKGRVAIAGQFEIMEPPDRLTFDRDFTAREQNVHLCFDDLARPLIGHPEHQAQ